MQTFEFLQRQYQTDQNSETPVFKQVVLIHSKILLYT